MSRFFFDIGPDGPNLRFDPWPFRRAKTVADWIAARLRAVFDDRDIPRAAERGIPPVNADGPSSKELEIRAAHRLKQDELMHTAQDGLAKLGTELSSLGTDVIDGELASIVTGLSGRLTEIEVETTGQLPALVEKKIETEAALRAFEHEQRLSNEPTARSMAIWLAVSTATATVEALVNGLLFRSEMGYGPGVAFAFFVGVAFAGMGTSVGIGAAQMKRRPPARKVAGAIWLLLMLGACAFVLLGMGHYRTALQGHGPDAVEAARASLAAAPLSPLGDFSLVPYLIINVIGIALVAWKSVPMFGFLDLKRHQAASERAVQKVVGCVNRALDACARALDVDLAETDKISERTSGNARRGKEILERGGQIVAELNRDNDRLSDSQAMCEQAYREIVLRIHPSREYLHFPPLTRLDDVALTLDAGWETIVAALEARSVTVRGSLPATIDGIYREVNAAKERIARMAVKLEIELRKGGGRADNVLQFGR